MTAAEFLLERLADDARAVRGRHYGDHGHEVPRSDPMSTERILADIESKRAVVLAYQTTPVPWAQAVLEGVIVTMAQPYNWHPDFQEDWKP